MDTKEIKAIENSANAEKNKKFSISAYQVVTRAIGFFIARAAPVMPIAPFGVAFMITEVRFSVSAILRAIFLSLGYLSLFDISAAAKYISAVFLYLLFLFALSKDEEDVPQIAAFCALLLSTLISGIGVMFFDGFTLMNIGILLADLVICAISATVFEHSRGVFQGRMSSLFSVNDTERAYLLLVGAIFLLGFCNIRIGNIFCAASIIGFLCVIIAAHLGGAEKGALCGAIVGAIIARGENFFVLPAVFAISGMSGGFFAKSGKYAVLISSCVSVTILLIYCTQFGFSPLGQLDILVAALSFLLIKDTGFRMLSRISGIKQNCEDNEKVQGYIKNRLNQASDSFRILAETFLDLSEKGTDIEEMTSMFDSVADRVCRECSRISNCWVNNFNSTYKAMFRMLEKMEKKGALLDEDLDEVFKKRCLRERSIIKEMNRLFEIYKINCVWKSKLTENRELAGEQLLSVAHILDNISNEICEEKIDSGAEEEIISRIEEKGILVSSLDVTIDENGRYFAYISFPCLDDLQKNRRISEGAFKAVLGVKMVPIGIIESKNGGVSVRFTEPEGYKIETGICSVGKADECGDNSIIRYLSNGKFAAALSDGMGTGHRAARDSGATVKLLGDFLEAGFDKSIAVRLINSIMVMKSANEAFATVDMCVIDLFSGLAEFVKNGAEPSYIKRGKEVEIVRNASLPIGAVKDMEIETFANKVCDGDIIVMISDGLYLKGSDIDWVKDMLKDTDEKMPAQEIADRIMDMAKALKNDYADDDMSVVVLKLVKR